MRVVKADSSLCVRGRLSHASVHLNRGGITHTRGHCSCAGAPEGGGRGGGVGGGLVEIGTIFINFVQLVRSKTKKTKMKLIIHSMYML